MAQWSEHQRLNLRDAWTETISAVSNFVHSYYVVLVHSDEYLAVDSG